MPDAERPAQPDLPSPYQPLHGPRRRGKRRARARRSHTVAKVLLATVLTLAMVSGLSVAFLYRHLNGNLNVVDLTDQLTNRPKKVHVDGPKEPLNILVMGSDSRDCEGCGIDQESGGGSDTTILFHLSADRQSAYGISIPRDSLVTRPNCIDENGDTIPGGQMQIWNAAFSYGGPACTIQQFEQTTGVPIDNFVEVDFNSFQDMVDAIDGVKVCVPDDIDDDIGHITIPAGTRNLTGKQALAYVRVRHGVGDGSDLGRIKRQQAFIASMVSKVVSAGTLARFDRLVRFLNAATKSLTTDIPNVKDLASIGREFKSIGLARIRFITVPIIDSPTQPGRVEWTSDAATLWDKILHDKPLGKLRAGSIGADQAPSTASPSATAGASPTEAESPSGSTSESASGSPSTPTGSPSETESIDADPDVLAQAGLCT